jgi:hypothetical protein
MEIKARFSRTGYVVLGMWVLLFAAMAFLEYSPPVMFIFIVLSVVIAGAKPFTYSILLEKDTIIIVWFKYFTRRTIVREVQTVTLELVYSGSTDDPRDAVLKVFSGGRCIHRASVNQGFEEPDFRKMIVKLEKLKISKQVV